SSMLNSSQDQSFSCFLYHLLRHRLQMINLQNPLDLRQQAVNNPKVASGNAHNCRQRFSIRKVIYTDMHPQVTPALSKQPSDFFPRCAPETDAQTQHENTTGDSGPTSSPIQVGRSRQVQSCLGHRGHGVALMQPFSNVEPHQQSATPFVWATDRPVKSHPS